MNEAAEGKTYGPVAFSVDEDRVRAFLDLFDGPPGVPPTFLAVAESSLFPQIVDDPELGLDFGRVLHGSQEYEIRRPLRVGETLRVEARIASIRQRGGSGFLTVEMQVVGADGARVAVARSTMIERGAR